MAKDLQYYVKLFSSLNVNRSHGRISPHKPVMLLSVLTLAEAGFLKENKIYYNQHLLEIFKSFFQTVARKGDSCNPYFPFFHLFKGEKFWHLKFIPGKDKTAESLSTIRGPSQISQYIEYAYLDEALFNLILSPNHREALLTTLLEKWFPDSRQQLRTVAAEERKIADYENTLRQFDEAAEEKAPYSDRVRNAAFSRVVREAYDYRCAASGWRVILPDGSIMVEAAHLIPFSESGNNEPGNGIALSPSYHWALDKNIIAPGPDLKWHVSRVLDKRNRDYQEIIEIDEKPIILPGNRKFYPRMDALEWRMSRLMG